MTTLAAAGSRAAAPQALIVSTLGARKAPANRGVSTLGGISLPFLLNPKRG